MRRFLRIPDDPLAWPRAGDKLAPAAVAASRPFIAPPQIPTTLWMQEYSVSHLKGLKM